MRAVRGTYCVCGGSGRKTRTVVRARSSGVGNRCANRDDTARPQIFGSAERDQCRGVLQTAADCEREAVPRSRQRPAFDPLRAPLEKGAPRRLRRDRSRGSCKRRAAEHSEPDRRAVHLLSHRISRSAAEHRRRCRCLQRARRRTARQNERARSSRWRRRDSRRRTLRVSSRPALRRAAA